MSFSEARDVRERKTGQIVGEVLEDSWLLGDWQRNVWYISGGVDDFAVDGSLWSERVQLRDLVGDVLKAGEIEGLGGLVNGHHGLSEFNWLLRLEWSRLLGFEWSWLLRLEWRRLLGSEWGWLLGLEWSWLFGHLDVCLLGLMRLECFRLFRVLEDFGNFWLLNEDFGLLRSLRNEDCLRLLWLGLGLGFERSLLLGLERSRLESWLFRLLRLESWLLRLESWLLWLLRLESWLLRPESRLLGLLGHDHLGLLNLAKIIGLLGHNLVELEGRLWLNLREGVGRLLGPQRLNWLQLNVLNGLLWPSFGDVEESWESLLVKATFVVGGQITRGPWVDIVGVTAALADHTVIWVSTVLRRTEIHEVSLRVCIHFHKYIPEEVWIYY